MKVTLLIEKTVEEGMESWKMLANPSILPLKNNRCDQPWYCALKTNRVPVVVPNELTPVDCAEYITAKMSWKRCKVVRM